MILADICQPSQQDNFGYKFWNMYTLILFHTQIANSPFSEKIFKHN